MLFSFKSERMDRIGCTYPTSIQEAETGGFQVKAEPSTENTMSHNPKIKKRGKLFKQRSHLLMSK